MNTYRASTISGSGEKIRSFMPRNAGHTVALEKHDSPSMHSFVSSPPEQTALLVEAENELITYETKALEACSYQTKQQTGLEKVPAVVAKEDIDEVVLICSLPHEEIEVALPRDLVPDSLAKYGTPVFLSIEVINGYKTPCVTKREVRQSASKDDPFADIESWLKNN